MSTDTSDTTSSVLKRQAHKHSAAAWKPLLQQLPSKSLTFQNIPNKELMKKQENTHTEYGTARCHFARLAAFRTSDRFIITSERTYQLIRNNCDRRQQRFPGLISTYIICCFLSFISFNHTYSLHVATLNEIYTGIANCHTFLIYLSQDPVACEPHVHLVLPTDYS